MANRHLHDKIRDALRKDFFKDPDYVDVSETPDDGIHLVIVSRRFDGRRMKDKNDLIWSVLVKNLEPDEWGQITLSIGVSPEELKAM